MSAQTQNAAETKQKKMPVTRIGKHPVDIPSGVDAQVNGQTVTVKGKLGELSLNVIEDIQVVKQENQIVVSRRTETRTAREMWATTRSLINNLVIGVSEGFKKQLEINGVGYRAQLQGKDLVLNLGFSHEIRYPAPEGIKFDCETPTLVTVSGASKQQVGQVAAEIRSYRKPEPYKGKGVKYVGEFILRKEGKKK